MVNASTPAPPKEKNFGYHPTALEAIDGVNLTGLTAVVTGGNSGIGVETVRALALAGAKVILCSRSIEAGQHIADDIINASTTGTPLTSPIKKENIIVRQLDLADLDSVKSLAETLNAELPTINLLILNAGVMACPKSHTKQGFEMQIGVNHIGHFYLTKLLLPKLIASGTPASPSRVISVASLAHTFGAINLEDLHYEHRRYYAFPAYGQSKLANVLFASELGRRMEAEGHPVLAYSLHPGNIMTNLPRYMPLISVWKYLEPLFLKIFMKTVAEGAATSVVAATAEGLPNGCYLDDCKPKAPSKRAQDKDMAVKLWEKTEEFLLLAKHGEVENE